MGGPNAVTGAMLTCSFGVAPASLVVLPAAKVMVEGRPAAAITAVLPGANIPPFGMCTTLSNPQVAALTAAALGILTPAPCVPVIPGTWMPAAPRTMIGGQPALVAGSTCVCAWGGVVSITVPGAVRTTSS